MLANLGTGYIVQRYSYSPIFFTAGLMHPLALTLVYMMLLRGWMRKPSSS
ncbi:MAG: hypothetical protein JNK48_08835, partial [Bryobacterales bacterium]|nr:hypothetical protein [Bryobacterales bacterium]